MNLSRLKDGLFQIPALSTRRIAISLVTAVIADGLQLVTQGIPFVPLRASMWSPLWSSAGP